MGILSSVGPAVRTVINELVADPTLHRDIVYKRKTGATAWDSNKKHPVATYTDMDIGAALLQHNERSLKAFGLTSEVQVGDHVYLVRYVDLIGLDSGLSKADFGPDDILVDDSEDRKITGIKWIFTFAAAITVAG